MATLGRRLRSLGGKPGVEFILASEMERLGLVEPGSDSDSGPSSSDLGPVELELNRLLAFDHDITIPAEEQGDKPFTKIGAGICGAVCAQQGEPYAIKLSKTRCHKDLWNDYLMHAKIAHCFNSRFFAQHSGLAEVVQRVCHFPTSALVMERILPLPERVRTLLIDKYCAEHIKEEARADAANKDCLVRVYLGSTKGKSRQRFFSLRNFKMHLNHMTELQLDIRILARRMGMAMALIHWAAETDGRGVEFVLGSSSKTVSGAIDPGKLWGVKPLSYTGPSSRKTEDFFRQVAATKLWVLDFHQVQPITMDRDGVAQAVEAVRLNDPFIPKPMQSTVDENEAWNAFAMSYLETAGLVLEGESYDILDLPLLFIEGLVQAERVRQMRWPVAGI
ncbi:zinc finger protein-domain-containing protein [Chaetomium sp. MPI-CAGE-AT-0009]|nr:zinc finger protein-domain-containing protein [Chaetomium sp. MPI-CAGE-AT-0009]